MKNQKSNHLISFIPSFFVLSVINTPIILSQNEEAIIIDHNCTDISLIPQSAIENAKENLHIVYSHTSHGSHITYGMSALNNFMNDKLVTQDLYAWSEDGTADGNNAVLYLRDFHTVSSTPILFNGEEVAEDVMFPRTSAHILADRKNWANDTRAFLNSEYAAGVNVLVWAWCYGVTNSTFEQIRDNYLLEMDSLEREFSSINFVYMTGHIDAGITDAYGEVNELNLIARNQQIRDYCLENNKILYDFADIESYDPDGNYYGDKHVDDGCNYDANGNDILETDGGDPGNPISGDANWATNWQDTHIQWNGSNGDVAEWFSCGTTHSQAINGNQKAYAAWHLWARLAGWEGNGGSVAVNEPDGIENPLIKLSQNYPNPFRGNTTIEYTIPENAHMEISLYDMLGKKVKILFKGYQQAGEHMLEINCNDIAAGSYYYKLEAGNHSVIKKCIAVQ